jgi:hypothetical protein
MQFSLIYEWFMHHNHTHQFIMPLGRTELFYYATCHANIIYRAIILDK